MVSDFGLYEVQTAIEGRTKSSLTERDSDVEPPGISRTNNCLVVADAPLELPIGLGSEIDTVVTVERDDLRLVEETQADS
jgi:hypothetical protein